MVALLLMPNCAEYVAIWLGLTPHRRDGGADQHPSCRPMRSRIASRSPRRGSIVVGAELAPGFAAVRARLERGLQVWVYGAGAQDFASARTRPRAVLRRGALPTAASRRRRSMPRRFISTRRAPPGLPKAAKVTHYRLMRWSQWFAGLDRYPARGPDVRLPAALSQRGRRGGGRRGCWRAAVRS